MCHEPVEYKSLQVDHLIPGHLESDRKELARVTQLFGLPDTFEIQSFENWMPACSACNGKKLGRVFQPTPIVQEHLERAREKAEIARKACERVEADARSAEVLTIIESGVKEGTIGRQDLEHLIKTLSDEERIEFTESIATDKAIEREFGIKMAQGPYGHGYVPISKFPHASFFCGHCGSLGPWNGARCMTCGMLDDGD
jgi:hypothetical protein